MHEEKNITNLCEKAGAVMRIFNIRNRDSRIVNSIIDNSIDGHSDAVFC